MWRMQAKRSGAGVCMVRISFPGGLSYALTCHSAASQAVNQFCLSIISSGGGGQTSRPRSVSSPAAANCSNYSHILINMNTGEDVFEN